MTSVNLTARELEILVAVVKEMKADVSSKVDWNKVAEATNCNTTKYARDKFASIRNKLQASASNGSGDANGGGDDADRETETPSGKPKQKATPRKRKTDVDDDESPTKKTATPRKSKSATPSAAKAEDDTTVKEEPNEAGEAMDSLG